MMMSKAMKGARIQDGKEYIERGAESRNGYFNHQNRRLGYKTSVSNDTSSTESLTKDTFASREFFVSKILETSSRHLKQNWARLSVCREERVEGRFSVSAGESPSSVNKVLCGAPLSDP